MLHHFVAVKSFLHKVDCFCPGSEHSELIKINPADLISISYERRFSMINGWYVQVEVNEFVFYMSIEDLEHYYLQGYLFSQIDLELRLNYLHYQINDSLDRGDESKFIEATQSWNEFKRLKEHFEQTMKKSHEVSYW